jgi:putative addiction module component (TIGR02574 family)
MYGISSRTFYEEGRRRHVVSTASGVGYARGVDLNSIRSLILALPADERASLAAELFDSLDAVADDGADVEHAWAVEIGDRLARVERGEVVTVPWDRARGFTER